jgi:LacI family transcriptional regulator
VSSVDNLSVGKLRVEGYLKALDDNNIPINEDIILRTDSEEDLNSKMKRYLIITPLTVFCFG